MSQNKTCSVCNGTGWIDTNGKSTMPKTGVTSSKFVYWNDPTPIRNGSTLIAEKCQHCNGTGKIIEKE